MKVTVHTFCSHDKHFLKVNL